MKYYKYIELKNLESIQRKTIAYLNKAPLIHGFNWLKFNDYIEVVPEILDSFKEHGLTPLAIATYITYYQEDSEVHVDYLNGKIRHQCRINIPILNCKGSTTEFYKGGEFEIVTQADGLQFKKMTSSSVVTKVDEVELIMPAIFRVQEPHRVNTNLETIPRITISIYTDIDPVFLLEE
jgi:hypothetical protein